MQDRLLQGHIEVFDMSIRISYLPDGTISVIKWGCGYWDSSQVLIKDTADGLQIQGDPELLKLFGGTRRGLVDFDRMDALYRSVSGAKAA